ncbi:hypothetical protein [Roseomonas genomospecies 6]|uniref:hypothetical protein n=1 Tax=Roseomonas genomospecies 6 TaxID=214106 RepID=UPI0011F1D5CE|nr:hypothetical protein [Roseomonas genomospecies 6]
MRHSVLTLAAAACLGLASTPAAAANAANAAGPAAFLNLSGPALSPYLNVPARPSGGGWIVPGNGGEAVVFVPPVVWGAGSSLRSGRASFPLSHPFGPSGPAQAACPGICLDGFGLHDGGNLIAARLAQWRNGGVLTLERTNGGAIRSLVVPARALRTTVR